VDINRLTEPLFSYLAGLLAADGSHEGHPDRKGRLQIELKERDGDLLERIAAAVPWRATVRARTRTTNFSRGTYTTTTLRICAQEARQFFAAAGIPAGPKSLTAAPPTPAFSRADYTRGLLDGDGSLGFTANGYPFISLTTASPALAAFACTTINDVCGVVGTAPPKHARWRVQHHGHQRRGTEARHMGVLRGRTGNAPQASSRALDPSSGFPPPRATE
jgi:hypothetical protein